MTEKQNSLLDIQKPPAEKLYAEELERLKKETKQNQNRSAGIFLPKPSLILC
ncbi:hypothetical protein LEP1GSC170_0409 [Leptospira interrogans serovar Bataviae str. HAI135]|nr:hypothetical protein LEP1GSC170_0409 [Leptospira interrogans serovar Bataviae str. HAI135]